MVKNAIKRVQSQACLSYAEREHFRRSQCSMFNVQWSIISSIPSRPTYCRHSDSPIPSATAPIPCVLRR